MQQDTVDHKAVMKTLMADMPSGVTIITTRDVQGTPSGATLSAVMSLSLDPPLMLAAFDRRSNTLRDLDLGKPFLIHVLSGSQSDLAMRFAGKASDKFDGVDWRAGKFGMPEIEGATGVITCTVAEVVPGGDHVIIIGAVDGIRHDPEVPTLTYHRRNMFSSRHLQEVQP